MNTITVLSGTYSLGQSRGQYTARARQGFAVRRPAASYGRSYARSYRGRRAPIRQRTQDHGRFAIENARRMARKRAAEKWLSDAQAIMAEKRAIFQEPAQVSQREQITVLPTLPIGPPPTATPPVQRQQITVLPTQPIGPPPSARLSPEQLAREVEVILDTKPKPAGKSAEWEAANDARRRQAMMQRLGIRGVVTKAAHRTLGIQGVSPWAR